MKRPYEKPTLTDLSLPTARAGWLPGGASPQGWCHTGASAGDRHGSCGTGDLPSTLGNCGPGNSPDVNANFCESGNGVV